MEDVIGKKENHLDLLSPPIDHSLTV
jgi:hypothetical protein